MSVRLCADEVQPLLISVTDEGHQYNTCPSPSLPPLHRCGSRQNHDIPAVMISDHDEDDDEHDQDATIIDFDPNGDAENPLEWPTAFKWSIVTILAFMAFTVTMTCMSVVPLATDIVQELSGSDTPSKSASVLLVTIWELGEAAGPLLIAPLSEMYGRYPVMNVCNVLFIAATIMAASSQSVPQFIVARMLTGLAVAGNVLNPAIVGDIFISEQRGSAVSLIYLAPLVGGAVGPLIGSTLAQAMGWRKVVWMTALLATAGEVVMFLVFKETYKVAILRKRAEEMMQRGLCKNVKTLFDHESDMEVAALMGSPRGEKNGCKQSALQKLRDSVLRPAYVLCGSGVLMAMSLFGAVIFTFFYVMSTTFADILQNVYGLSPVAVGSCYASFTIGSTISVFICNHSLDRIYIRMRETHKGVSQPEFRLPLAIVGAFLLPIAVLLYGWIPQLQLPLVLLLLSVSFLGSTLMLAMIPMMTYIVDAFGLYSASALTGVMVTRCLMGTFLPLSTAPLVENFGYGWGFSVLAGLAFLMAPIPILMMRYGSRWRQFSKYSREQ
ncbi:major facilitator superfamily domain-containing protein [Podospora australis]|uniref:Major facilitator superfamily domain-containing protein n=1 Tax=Podospora australis TaxID=1536484 RepID=A0AAN7AIF2_9PEZI|nr:major facilitator superfamily domain-containing protein [Podospora australis]